MVVCGGLYMHRRCTWLPRWLGTYILNELNTWYKQFMFDRFYMCVSRNLSSPLLKDLMHLNAFSNAVSTAAPFHRSAKSINGNW